MTIDAEFLLSRLPAFYRQRDAEEGGTLRALLTVIAEQGALLEADIAKLYDSWFIETCDEWLVPYIGDLLGVRGLYGVEGTQAFGQRALVANTLRLRRRKGTLAVLEELAYDTTGWRARAVEFFQLLETTQHVNHRRLFNLRTPDLRRGTQLERIDGPFDKAAHTLEVRPLPAGRYNIPNIGLYQWRLQAYAVQRGTATKVTSRDGLFTFDPLGRSLPLFNRPRTETDISHLAEPVNVPERLSRRVLYDELTAYRQSVADGTPDPRRYFADSEGGPVLRVWVDEQLVPTENLVICNLSPLPNVSPEDWRRPSVDIAVQPGDSELPPVVFPRKPGEFLVGVDPELGRIALSTGTNPGKVEVAYAYGFPGDIGGGPYDRRPLRHEDDTTMGLFKPADFDRIIRVPADQPNVNAALAQVSAGQRWLIRINSDATEHVAANLDLANTHLAIEATNRRRPVLTGDFSFKGNGDSRLSLSGLLLAGQLKLSGALRRVELRHCTLIPDEGGIQHSGTGSELNVVLIRSICGPLTADKAIAAAELNDCVVDAGAAVAFDLPDTRLSLNRCTVFGTAAAGELEASNSLFTEKVEIERRQQGCVRFCYVPDESRTPRRYRCLPDLVVLDLPAPVANSERVRVMPGFTAADYGSAAYAQLQLSTAVEVLTGAEDGAEMGVWNLLKQPQREANLRQALDEYLRFGLEAGVIYVN
ncbi:MAG: phage tail protein [Lysobacterales bacterium]|jgi:hypothetical protein